MKKKTKSVKRNARSNLLLQQRVISILKIKPEGIPANEVAEAAGCSVLQLYVWYANHGKSMPGITRPKSNTLGWDQSAADATKK